MSSSQGIHPMVTVWPSPTGPSAAVDSVVSWDVVSAGSVSAEVVSVPASAVVVAPSPPPQAARISRMASTPADHHDRGLRKRRGLTFIRFPLVARVGVFAVLIWTVRHQGREPAPARENLGPRMASRT